MNPPGFVTEIALPPSRIVLVSACDENYAMPLAVALHSACRNVAKGCRIQCFLLDGGLSPSSWAALRETLADQPIDLEGITPDAAPFKGLKTSHHITRTAYFRLLAAELLPSDLHKAIYLDPDVLVQGDLSELWTRSVDNLYCLAAADISCPFVDARASDKRFRKSLPFLNVLRPIPNYKALDIDRAAEYFNSGVMVLNLEKWRRENAGQRLLDCLRENTRHVWCWDQYALNVVFAGAWGRLQPRWNQGAHIYEYPSELYSPIDAGEFIDMRDRPAVIHFTTRRKPWHYGSQHPLRGLFYAELDRTAWRGWRPSPERPTIRAWWNEKIERFFRQLTISFRTLAALWAKH